MDNIKQFSSFAEKRRFEREQAKKVLAKINEGLRMTFATEADNIRMNLASGLDPANLSERELEILKNDKDGSFIANPPESEKD